MLCHVFWSQVEYKIVCFIFTTNVEVPLQVTTKDPKKFAVGNRLAEWRCKNKEKLAKS